MFYNNELCDVFEVEMSWNLQIVGSYFSPMLTLQSFFCLVIISNVTFKQF